MVSVRARIVLALLLVLGVSAVAWFVYSNKSMKQQMPTNEGVVEEDVVEAPDAATTTSRVRTIGTSVEGRVIESYTFGNGPDRLLFIGGIHGGYEWNSVLLAYEFIDHLEKNPSEIPENVTIEIVPNANPDGTFDVIGKSGRFTLADVPADEGPLGTGRFNANGVDLNRNFACKWQPTSSWRGNVVSAGTEPFSEPEAKAIRDLALTTRPLAVTFWHSQANAVYASKCETGILPATLVAMRTYANAAGYAAIESFDAYPVTGDAEGWLASVGIPAITVELETHQTVEWERNLAGFRALVSQASALK